MVTVSMVKVCEIDLSEINVSGTPKSVTQPGWVIKKIFEI